MLRPVPQKCSYVETGASKTKGKVKKKYIRITVPFRDVTHPTINQSVQTSPALCCGFNHISPCQHD